MEHHTEIEEAAYNLAMMGLQSNRYIGDKIYAEAVDRVIGLTLFKGVAFEPRTIESDLLEDR